MFGTLNKLADKSFVIGFYLPALVFAVCLALTAPMDSPIASLAREVFISAKFTDITLAALGIWLFAVLLMAGNYWMYRALEGYWGPLKLEFFRRRAVRDRNIQAEKINAFEKAWNALEPGIKGKPLNSPEVIAAHHAQDQFLNSLIRLRKRYPRNVANILPTKFGNVIAAFESYPAITYNVETISIWPRLQAVMPKEFAFNLTEAKSQVDFFVNVVYLAGLLLVWLFAQISIAAFVGELRYQLLIPIALTGIAGRAAYALAVSSAMIWGDVVKAAFDLYLPTLAQQLGYKYPATGSERAAFWEAFTGQFQFHDAITPEKFVPLQSTDSEVEGGKLENQENQENQEEREGSEGKMEAADTNVPASREDGRSDLLVDSPKKVIEL
jgi:hypothetical protein